MTARRIKREWIECDGCGTTYEIGGSAKGTRLVLKDKGWTTTKGAEGTGFDDWCPDCSVLKKGGES